MFINSQLAYFIAYLLNGFWTSRLARNVDLRLFCTVGELGEAVKRGKPDILRVGSFKK